MNGDEKSVVANVQFLSLACRPPSSAGRTIFRTRFEEAPRRDEYVLGM